MLEGPLKSWLGIALGTVAILVGLFLVFLAAVAIVPIALVLGLLYVAVGVGVIRCWHWARWVAIPLVVATAAWVVFDTPFW